MAASAATEAFEQAFDNFVRESTQPTALHGPQRLYNIFTGELEPGHEDLKYAIVSYIYDPSKLPEFPRLVRREAVSKEHASRGEMAPNEGKFRFGVPVGSSDTEVLVVSPEVTTTDQASEAVSVEDELALWEYDSKDFDAVVELACVEKNIEGNWMVQIDEDFDQRAAKLAAPKIEIDITGEHRSYLQEICKLVSCEADRRGLSYIWMDVICIDQTDPSDKSRQIPRMTEYFRRAEACVVVSEMVRRKLSHRLDRLGADVLNPSRRAPWECVLPRKSDDEYRRMQIERQRESGVPFAQVDEFSRDHYEALAAPNWRDFAGYSEEERRYRAKWGLQDEIAGWLIGFHEMRVWTFQETIVARDIIHVGGNLRIDTVSVLVMEEYWREYENIESTMWPVEWLPTPYKFERLQYLRFKFLESLHVRFPLPSKDYLYREFSRSAGPGLALEDSEWSLNQCLSIVQEQQRTAAFEQDKIYGILGMFPLLIRFTLPARYDISLSTIFTILTYLRICGGDLYAFFFTEDRSAPEHGIVDAPSWIPRRHGQMQILQPKPSQTPIQQGDPVRPAWPTDMIRVERRKLIITAPYLEIAECADPEDDLNPIISLDHDVPLHTGFFANSFWLLPHYPKVDGDPNRADFDSNNEPAITYKPRLTNWVRIGHQDFLSGNISQILEEARNPRVAVRQNRPRRTKVELMEPYSREINVMDVQDVARGFRQRGMWTVEHYQEIRENRLRIAQAVAAGQAVMVNFAYHDGGTELWLVLISSDGGETWQKAGNLVIYNNLTDEDKRSGITLEPWQKINKHAKTFVVL